MPDLGLEVLWKGRNFVRLLGGLWTALRISLLAVSISIPLGMLLGMLMTRKNLVLVVLTRFYLEFIRVMPQMVLLFLVFFGTTRWFGWNLDGELSSVIVRHIVLPQTLRRLIPLSINLITRMIKTTSLVLMIGVVEMLKVSQQIIEANRMSSPNAAFGVYLTVFLLYFLACWPISLLAKTLEKRWS